MRTTIDIHLADEGRASYHAHPAQSRAVIVLETTAASVELFVDAQNLHRLSQIISEAQAALAAEPFGLAELAGPGALVGKAA